MGEPVADRGVINHGPLAQHVCSVRNGKPVGRGGCDGAGGEPGGQQDGGVRVGPHHTVSDFGCEVDLVVSLGDLQLVLASADAEELEPVVSVCDGVVGPVEVMILALIEGLEIEDRRADGGVVGRVP